MTRVFRSTVPELAFLEALMGNISYLTKRGAVYYARMDVPEELVLILKTQTRKQSLKTKDEAEASAGFGP